MGRERGAGEQGPLPPVKGLHLHDKAVMGNGQGDL